MYILNHCSKSTGHSNPFNFPCVINTWGSESGLCFIWWHSTLNCQVPKLCYIILFCADTCFNHVHFVSCNK